MISDGIDLAALPGLDVLTGIFGSAIEGAVYSDTVVAILVYVYDNSASMI